MLKLFRNAVVVGVVVAAGAGCSKGKDEVTKDVFNAPAPKVIPADLSESSINFDDARTYRLDLQDKFDLSGGSPVRAIVNSGCDAGGNTINKTFTFEKPTQIPVSALVPKEIFLEGALEISKLSCGFEFQLINGNGSTRIFFLNHAKLGEETPSSVILQRGVNRYATSDSSFSFLFEEAGEVNVRYENSSTVSAEVACEDFLLDPVGLDQSIAFEKFDITNPELKPGRLAEAIQQHPEQTCRILVLENSKVIALSASFRFTALPQPPPPPPAPPTPPPPPLPDLTVETAELPYRTDTSGFGNAVDAFNNGTAMKFSAFNLGNTSNSHRTFRISKAFRANADAFTYWQEGPNPQIPTQAFRISAPHLKLVPVAIGGGVVVTEDSNYWTIHSTPNSVFRVDVYFAPDAPALTSYLNQEGLFLGIGIEAKGKGIIEEINENNYLVSTKEFGLGEILVAARFGEHPAPHLVAIPVYTGGPWR